MGNDPLRDNRADSEPAQTDRIAEWAALGEWFGSPPLWHKVDLEVLQERLGFMGRARACLAALEADVVAEISRREGDAVAEETVRRTQKRSRAGARKAVKVAAQLEWAPRVADKLADGAITPEAAGLILDAAGETPVDHGVLLEAAESEPDDLFRRTLKEHVNERTSEQELEARRARQRRRRRAWISEEPDGMFHLFAQFDPLTGNRVRNALLAKTDQLFRTEDPRTARPHRSASPTRSLTSSATATAAVCRRGWSYSSSPTTTRCARRSPTPASPTTPASPKPKPSHSRVTPRSCRASSTNTPATPSWAAPNARSPPGSANSSSPATAAASAAAPTTKSAKSTTSATGNTAAKPPSTTPASSAGAATTSASTKTANKSPATPAANSPSAHQLDRPAPTRLPRRPETATQPPHSRPKPTP